MKSISDIFNQGVGISGLRQEKKKFVDKSAEKKEMARKLLSFGCEIDVVIKVTALSYNEVVQIQQLQQVQQKTQSNS